VSLKLYQCGALSAVVSSQLTFPPSLTARQRALLHEFAEGAGLQHASTGEGSSRRLQLGPEDARNKVCHSLTPLKSSAAISAAAAATAAACARLAETNGRTCHCLSVKPAQLCPALIWLHASVLQVTIGDDAEHPAAAAAALTDDAIAELLQQHLSTSPAAFRDAATKQPPQFNGSNASSQGPKQQGQGPNKHLKTGSSGPKAQVAEYASVEAFVGVMGKLLDMERDAEVSAAQEATSLCSMSAAQVRKHRLHSQPPCLRRALHDFQGLCHLVPGACVKGQDKLPRKVV
jgi:hypothetical protein